MSRKFAPIAAEDFQEKYVNKLTNGKWLDFGKFNPQLSKDINKVEFDCENVEDGEGFGEYPCGFTTLPNGMHCQFINAGGDWEFPVCFIIYWDGKTFRGYVPSRGNFYNKKTKQAFGSEYNIEPSVRRLAVQQCFNEVKEFLSEKDKNKFLKAYAEFEGEEGDEFKEADLLVNRQALYADIQERIISK